MEANIDNIPRYIEQGLFHKDWYANESQRLIDLLPEFEGLPIIRCFAVTSMTTSIEANVHLALKALLQIKRGQEIKGFLPNHILYLNRIIQGLDVPGRKIMNFIRALEGDPNAVVVDVWMCHAFGLIHKRKLPDGRDYYKSPSNKEYTLIEHTTKDFAWWCDLEPRQVQSMIWAGIKQEKSVISKNVSWSELLIKKRGLFPMYEKMSNSRM